MHSLLFKGESITSPFDPIALVLVVIIFMNSFDSTPSKKEEISPSLTSFRLQGVSMKSN